MKTAAVLALAVLLTSCATGAGRGPQPVVWKIRSLKSIGGHAPQVQGHPKLSLSGHVGLCFDGKVDGIFLAVNPIEGWGAFTIEALIKPDGDGPAEQRFLHIQDDKEQRVLIETRVTAEHTWALDTFLRASDTDKLTLLDRTLTNPTDQWYWVALVYDGKTQAHYVNGAKQLEGAVAFPPMVPGRISLGVRLNLIHWFKGCISEVRFSPVALDAARLRRPN